MTRLNGTTAVITGGASGIGLAAFEGRPMAKRTPRRR